MGPATDWQVVVARVRKRTLPRSIAERLAADGVKKVRLSGNLEWITAIQRYSRDKQRRCS